MGNSVSGVSVFDFKMPPPPSSDDAKISPVFVGYGRIPGLDRRIKFYCSSSVS